MTQPVRFREKPREIEAKLFDGDTDALMEVVAWIKEAGYIWFDMFTPAPAKGVTMHPETGFLIISNMEAKLTTIQRGTWVGKDLEGNFEAITPEKLGNVYEPVVGNAPVNVGGPHA